MRELDQGSAGIRQYPVGSICIVVAADEAKEMIGKEVTITESLDWRWSDCGLHVWLGYGTDVVFPDNVLYTPRHDQLKLKRYPGQLGEWATEKVKQLFTPNPKLVEETA